MAGVMKEEEVADTGRLEAKADKLKKKKINGGRPTTPDPESSDEKPRRRSSLRDGNEASADSTTAKRRGSNRYQRDESLEPSTSTSRRLSRRRGSNEEDDNEGRARRRGSNRYREESVSRRTGKRVVDDDGGVAQRRGSNHSKEDEVSKRGVRSTSRRRGSNRYSADNDLDSSKHYRPISQRRGSNSAETDELDSSRHHRSISQRRGSNSAEPDDLDSSRHHRRKSASQRRGSSNAGDKNDRLLGPSSVHSSNSLTDFGDVEFPDESAFHLKKTLSFRLRSGTADDACDATTKSDVSTIASEESSTSRLHHNKLKRASSARFRRHHHADSASVDGSASVVSKQSCADTATVTSEESGSNKSHLKRASSARFRRKDKQQQHGTDTVKEEDASGLAKHFSKSAEQEVKPGDQTTTDDAAEWKQSFAEIDQQPTHTKRSTRRRGSGRLRDLTDVKLHRQTSSSSLLNSNNRRSKNARQQSSRSVTSTHSGGSLDCDELDKLDAEGSDNQDRSPSRSGFSRQVSGRSLRSHQSSTFDDDSDDDDDDDASFGADINEDEDFAEEAGEEARRKAKREKRREEMKERTRRRRADQKGSDEKHLSDEKKQNLMDAKRRFDHAKLQLDELRLSNHGATTTTSAKPDNVDDLGGRHSHHVRTSGRSTPTFHNLIAASKYHKREVDELGSSQHSTTSTARPSRYAMKAVRRAQSERNLTSATPAPATGGMRRVPSSAATSSLAAHQSNTPANNANLNPIFPSPAGLPLRRTQSSDQPPPAMTTVFVE